MSENSKNKEEAYNGIKELVEKFKSNYKQFHSSDYNETLTRQDFINPFFEYLGWDISNKEGLSQTYRDVIHEDKLKIGKETKAPDYSFRIGGNRVFFVEAKKPSRNLKEDSDAAYQIRRYAWSGKLAVSILTDFEEFAIYDCSKKPSPNDKASMSRIEYINYEDYLNRFDFLYDTFAKENVLRGSLEKYNADTKSKKGTESVDIDFLNSLDDLRTKLASNISKLNSLSLRDLNFAVQHIIDRIIFLRVAEDRGVENYGDLREACCGNNYYKNIVEIFKKADGKYNSGIFDFSKDKITQNIEVDNKVIKEIINDLYYPKSPYEFLVISVEIIGNAYEQFLGKTITIGNNSKAKIELKPEVRKAGGVYYTPEYIVDYIVENTVGEKIKGKTPKEIANIKIVDPACGSGSFLLGAYKYLLNYHIEYYNKIKDRAKFKGVKEDVIKENGDLTIWIKKQILRNNIFGVDIDSNAAEVTKLSLLMKCLEGESPASIQNNQDLFNERALPSLEDNIKCGNSLIGNDFYESQSMLDFDDETQYKINCFDWEDEFKNVFACGGFDVVIGNPPYETSRSEGIDNIIKDYLRDNYKTSEDKFDYYTFFMEKSSMLSKNGTGVVSLITPSTYLMKPLSKKIRQFLLFKHNILRIDEFKGMVFKAVVPTSIIIFKKTDEVNINNKIKVRYNIFTRDNFDNEKFNLKEIEQDRFNKEPDFYFNIYADESYYNILEKISKLDNVIKLGELSEIYNGIQTGNDKEYISMDKKNNKWFPVIVGSDINRYTKSWGGKYVYYVPEKLHSNTRENIFKTKEKIIIRQTSDKIIGTYDDESFFTLASTFIIKQFNEQIDYKALLGILNSKLFYYLYVNLNNEQGRVLPQIKKKHIFNLPIIIGYSEVHKQLSSLVNGILDLNKKLAVEKNPNSITIINRQINAVDKQIDALVYKLYNLSDEEIRVIEGD